MAVWFWIVWLFSFGGWVLERAFAALTRSPRQRRRCLWVEPLCPVYGLGMVAVLALPTRWLAGWRLVFWGGLTATAVEYLCHWWGETFLGVRFWDYTGLPGQLRGRVCLPFSLAWGLLLDPAVRLARWAVCWAAEIPAPVTWAVLMFFTADALCSLRFLSQTHDLEAMRQSVWPTAG